MPASVPGINDPPGQEEGEDHTDGSGDNAGQDREQFVGQACGGGMLQMGHGLVTGRCVRRCPGRAGETQNGRRSAYWAAVPKANVC